MKASAAERMMSLVMRVTSDTPIPIPNVPDAFEQEFFQSLCPVRIKTKDEILVCVFQECLAARTEKKYPKSPASLCYGHQVDNISHKAENQHEHIVL